MRRALAALVLVMSAVGSAAALVPGRATATPPPQIVVDSTNGAAMYPDFDPAIHRYGITTTAATNGTVTLTVPAGSTVNGEPASGEVTLGGLNEGDEIAVGMGAQNYGFIYLPAEFPAMAATGTATFGGYLGVGLTTFGSGSSAAFEALLDSNGVPAWVHSGTGNDLKRQPGPNGKLTVMRPTTASAPRTGSDLVTLDEQLRPTQSLHMRDPLTDTDNHDSEQLADGSTILIGYEPRGACTTGYLDATIQKIGPSGNVVFHWSSEGLEGETLNPLPWPQGSVCPRIDYAHINSVQEIPDGTHDLLVSFRHFSSVYRISTDPTDIHPHNILWKLGGRHSDFAFAGGDGGPCAQHNATWLSENRVLLFDNGSTALGQSAASCVNPLLTSGAGIARTYTRVSEYVLDTSAGTATLDWSYVPAPTDFTFFAGSATRLTDGDTVVGWASDRTRLATEVDHASTPHELWSLKVPTNTRDLGYTSYRVNVVPYVDKTAPVPHLDQVDGATYVSDQAPVVPTWSCTDRGGSTMTGCTVSGLVDGHLSTAPGRHTVSVTARDGAGNTAVAAAGYTVRPAHQADGLVRKSGAATWRGDNVYGAATSQSVGQRARRGKTVVSYWRIQNDGERSDAFRLSGTAGSPRMRVHYFSGRTDITRAVVGGTYPTTTLSPTQWTTVRVEVTPTRRSRSTTVRTFALRSTSVADGTSTDQVAVRVARR